MTIVEPLPAGGYGKADWVDYSNYWREADAEWIQERLTLRYADAAARTSQWPTPKFGQIVYNESSLGPGLDRPEMYSKQHGKWVPILMLDNITSTKDDNAGVALSHKGAGGKGVIFEPTRTQFDNPIWVMGGVLGVDSDSVDIKTGAKTAKLTTNATDLVSDSPISAPSISTAGAVTAGSAVLSGPLTVPAITLGGTLSGGVLNGTSGVIGGVSLGAAATGGVNIANASGGFQSQVGAFYGDSSYAYMRQRAANAGALGAAGVRVSTSEVSFDGTNVWVNGPYLRIQGKGVPWHNTAGTHVAWIAPSLYSASDPGAANYPDGTIWVS